MQKGIELAVAEINAKHGILGRRIELTTLDSQSSASTAKLLAQRAVDMNAYAIIGPIFSGSILASMAITREHRIPNFTGAAASKVTQVGNPYVFRSSLSQDASAPRVVAYMKDAMCARTVSVVWAHNDFGKGGRDVLLREAQARGMEVVADLPSEQGQTDFVAEITRLRAARADVLFPYLNEEESARFIRQLREQGYAGEIVGESTSVSQKVIELAGTAANGVLGHVALSPEVPDPAMRAFVARLQRRFGTKPDHNAIAGYMAPYIIKTVTERIGKFDRVAFAAAMRGVRLRVADEPGLLMDLDYDAQGDPSHGTWIVQVQDGKQVLLLKAPY